MKTLSPLMLLVISKLSIKRRFDMKLKFAKFDLGILSSLGGDVISNIRGLVSGNSTIQGNLKKPILMGVCMLKRLALFLI
jgi:hypothetical protein